MKNVFSRNVLLLLLVISTIFVACSSGNRMGGTSKKCGCGLNKGFVGY